MALISRRNFKKFLLKNILLLVGLFILTIPLFWLGLKQPENLQKTQAIIAHYQVSFIAFRWVLIITGFTCWPRMIHALSVHRHWSEEKMIFWLKQRLRLFIWLALFELVVCENIFLYFLHLLEGSA